MVPVLPLGGVRTTVKFSVRHRLLAFAVVLTAFQPGYADSQSVPTKCRTQCANGKWVEAPCPHAGTPRVDPCKAAGSPRPDNRSEGTARAEAEAARRAEAEAQLGQEEDARRRAAYDANERKRQLAQAEFNRARDSVPLRRGGSTVSPNVPSVGRGATAGTDLRSGQASRDLQGRQSAWKQLNCAVWILADALPPLRESVPSPTSFTDFKYLAGEATNVLNGLSGVRVGVRCSDAPPVPSAYGREGYDTHKYRTKYLAVLEHAQRSAAALEKAQRKLRKALDQMIDAKAQVLRLEGGSNAVTQVELARLRADRAALGPAIVRPPMAPPSPSPALDPALPQATS